METTGLLSICPSCGNAASGRYCVNCGEDLDARIPRAHHYILAHIADFAMLDSRIVRTIPALLFKPGLLTKEYLAGRRRHYLAPSRLYLFISIVMFFLIGNMAHNKLVSGEKSNT